MEGLEEKLNAVLSNPQLMQSIMQMAQGMGSQAQPAEEPKPSAPSGIGGLDPAALQAISRLAGQGGIDKEQQALLGALRPYLSHQRLGKLEKAMRAAKMARFASTALSQGGLSFLTGR